MTSQSGGASVIPGVTSDGLTPGGEIVAGALHAGDVNAVNVPTLHKLYGGTTIQSSLGNDVDGDDPLDVEHLMNLAATTFVSALLCTRAGSLNGHDAVGPVLGISDQTAASGPAFQVVKQGTTVLEITTQKSITGALASVTDANAKAVLTSIIAALTGIKVATNNTT